MVRGVEGCNMCRSAQFAYRRPIPNLFIHMVMHGSRARARAYILALENGVWWLELTGSSGAGLWKARKKEGTWERGERGRRHF